MNAPTPEVVSSAPTAPTENAPPTAPAPVLVTPEPRKEWRKGQPKSPWRVRKEAEAAAVADVERRVLEAIQEGRGLEVLHASEIALARVCFSVFCRLAWHVLEPTTHLDWGRHHELICTVLQALFEDWLRSKQDRNYFPLVRNTVFNCPPGSLKSKLIAVLFQAWVWIRAPGTKFICVSVNELAALRDARDTRTLMASEWYQLNFQPSFAIKDDQDAISDFGNTAGGTRLSRPSGSTIIGLRGDCVGAGVPVATEIGHVPIESLHEMAERRKGLPRVWSLNHATGALELRAIQATRRIPDREVIDVCAEAGHRLRCTADHRVYADGAYTPATELAGRRVATMGRHGEPVELVAVTTVLPALEGGRRTKVDVYDLQVEGNHNFFAGEILVHNCLLGDDLNDPDKSYEAAERDKVNSTWDNNQYKRVNDELRSLRICVQQRVHTDDHTGHVLRKQGLWSPQNRDGWLHVVLPAEFETARPRFELPVGLRKYVRHLPGAEIRDWRTAEGEILHPARMTPESLAAEKKRCAGTSNYACQMQQRPVDAAGGKIKREWFGFFRLEGGVRSDLDEHELGRVRPEGCEKAQAILVEAAHYRPGFWDFDLVVLSVDPALKKTERGSLWGMIAAGIKGGRRFILDDRSQRGEPDDAIHVLKEMVITWKPDKILIENKAGGEGLRRNLEIEMGNGDMPMVELVMVDPGTQDKDARLNSAIPTIANGMLFLRDGAPWLESYVEELVSFPLFTTNDRVDATVMMLNHISTDEFAYPSASAWGAAVGRAGRPYPARS